MPILSALTEPQLNGRERDTPQPGIGFKARLGHLLAHLVPLRRFLTSHVEVRRLDVRLPDLPPALDGFCIAQVSDLHVGVGMWLPLFIAEAAEIIRSESPHMVVNTGDYFQEEPPVEKVIAVARQFLIEPGPDTATPANLAVLGNHDYWAGDDAVAELTRCLEDLGVHVLVNRGVCVYRNGAGISFVGLTDDDGFEEAVATLLASSRSRIALIHQPDLVESLPSGAADLVLSGHTHGGQITLPGLERFVTRRIAHSKYVGGWNRINHMPVYVNRGFGTSGLPIRFRAPPEVTFFRLVR